MIEPVIAVCVVVCVVCFAFVTTCNMIERQEIKRESRKRWQ